MALQRFIGRYRKLPRLGKILVGLSLVLLLLSGGYYAVLTFSGTSIRGGNMVNNTSFQWSGDRLVLYNSSSRYSVSCTVRSNSEEQFGVAVPSQGRNQLYRTEFASLRKTFSGAAEVSCTDDASAYEDGLADQFAFISSPLYKVSAIAIIATPWIVFGVIQRNRARQRKNSES